MTNNSRYPSRTKTGLRFRGERAVTKFIPRDEHQAIDEIQDNIASSWIGLDGQLKQSLSGKMRRRRGSDEDLHDTSLPDEAPFGYASPELFES